MSKQCEKEAMTGAEGFRRIMRYLVIIGLGCLPSGCATVSLTMQRERPPVDQSTLASKLKAKKYSSIMVIPPSGTARGVFEPRIVLFEQEFLKRDVRVISGAITGRVVLDSADEAAKKNEAAAELSDMERALIMAKKTGADAILQVGEFTWSTDSHYSRFFVSRGENGGTCHEVDYQEFCAWHGSARFWFHSRECSFIGRLVDVENGEVVASLSIRMPANYSLPADYLSTWQSGGSGPWTIVKQNYIYDRWQANADGTQALVKPWENDTTMKRVEARIIEFVVARITEP